MLICRLADVGISEETCETLALALQSDNPYLRELDLSNNYIGDSGVELLCVGLISPNCFLEKLRSVQCLHFCFCELRMIESWLRTFFVQISNGYYCLNKKQTIFFLRCSLQWCNVTERSCLNLASVLSSHTRLTELELRDNDVKDTGLKLICAGLPGCSLQKLGSVKGAQQRNGKELYKEI